MTDSTAPTTVFTRQPDGSSASEVARLTVKKDSDAVTLVCSGVWTCDGIHGVDEDLQRLAQSQASTMILDTSHITSFDSSGAWLMERTRRSALQEGRDFQFLGLRPELERLLSVIASHTVEVRTAMSVTRNPVETIGRAVNSFWRDSIAVCNMIGAALRGTAIKTGARGGIRVTSLINQMDHMGVRAIPVITVMSFLIGAIIAQQSAYQLKSFGEELLTVNLVGILHLREIGVLLTAVMVAGRSGSAITAEIGSMKMREEIDALQVIGLNPIGVLVVPRLIALVIVLPILTLLADFSGLAGALLVSWFYVGIEPVQFITTLQDAVDTSTVLAGLIKAPFMALVIGLIATLEGLKVKGSAESLGQRTTSSVVRAIFAVIVIDGVFAMFYASIGY